MRLPGRRRVRVEPRLPQPRPLGEAEWARIAAALGERGPGVIGATGGSGTRVLARIVRRAGMFVGDDLDRSEDALDFAAFSDRWINALEAGERPPELVGELRAADAGERLLGERYLPLRFEDLCADPPGATAAALRFFGLDGDAQRISAEEVVGPSTLGRWRERPPQEIAALQRTAGEALRRLGYQSSSA